MARRRPDETLFAPGRKRPRLTNWDGGGPTDLDVGHPCDWTLAVSARSLAGETEVVVQPIGLPAVPDASSVQFVFAGWDGDGRLDLLAAVQYRDEKDGAMEV